MSGRKENGWGVEEVAVTLNIHRQPAMLAIRQRSAGSCRGVVSDAEPTGGGGIRFFGWRLHPELADTRRRQGTIEAPSIQSKARSIPR